MRRRTATDRGAATAELVVVLPTLVAVAAGLVWLLSVGTAQVRTVDAAREAARAVARGDDVTAAVALAEQVAPDGVRVHVTTEDGRVVARATGRIAGPGGIFGFLPGAQVEAEAVAAAEERSDAE